MDSVLSEQNLDEKQGDINESDLKMLLQHVVGTWKQHTTEQKTSDPKTPLQKVVEILERPAPIFPAHWKSAERTDGWFWWLRKALFDSMCVSALGHPGLEYTWAAIQLDKSGDESVWVDGITRMSGRFSDMLLVVRLGRPANCGFAWG